MRLDIFAEDPDVTRGRTSQAEKHVQGGRLARAVNSEQTQDLTLAGRESHVFDRFVFGELFFEILNFDNSIQHCMYSCLHKFSANALKDKTSKSLLSLWRNAKANAF